MMKINFSISEFNISGEAIPEKIADKILRWHIQPMQTVRKQLNKLIEGDVKLFPSLKSGFRPYSWEIKNKRSGKSQHTFGQKRTGIIYASELGAVDWTCTNFIKNKTQLLKLIIKHTEYKRIAIYNTFIHCDYKDTPTGKREVYKSTASSSWTRVSVLD